MPHAAAHSLRPRQPRSAFPSKLAPQLATLVDAPPERGDWLYEVKYDGYRILARIDAGEVRLFTRYGTDWTQRFWPIAHALKRCKGSKSWLDGEIVALGPDGNISFQALQNAMRGDPHVLAYFVFDVPFLRGRDLRSVPLTERRASLEELLKGFPRGGPVRLSEQVLADGGDALQAACRHGLEGLIGKLRDAPYVSGRSASWIKLKCRQRQEFVIAGFTDPQRSRTHFGALLLGVYDMAGQLRYAGRVGTGFDKWLLADLHQRLRALKTDAPSFADSPMGARARGVHWVKPKLVGEVSFAEWTEEGIVRQAAFEGLRRDKQASEVRREWQTPVEAAIPAIGVPKCN